MKTQLLVAVALALAAPAFAASHVEIQNQTTQRVCFGTTTLFNVEDEGAGSESFGWECVGPQTSYFLDVADVLMLSATDETGTEDFLANRMLGYESGETMAPSGFVNSFGLEIVARVDRRFSYAYMLEDQPWTEDAYADDWESVVAALIEQGFRKMTGRILRSTDLGPNARIVITF
jgi:hypothetical protein